jgi:drug/metabolite transporter (DMT)-like permease
VSNCIIARYVLKETVRKRNIFGVVLALIGAVFIVTYAPDSQKQLTMELLETYMMEPSLIAFIICILLAIAGLFMYPETQPPLTLKPKP